MQTAFLALANYILTVLLLAYNVQAFCTVIGKEGKKHKRVRIAMRAEVASVLVLCFFVLYLESERQEFLWFGLMQLVTYGILAFVYQKLYPRLSELLFYHMLMLLCIGSVILSRLDFFGAVRQFVIVAIALVAALFIPAFIRAMHRLERYGYGYLAIGIMILLLVFLFAGERLGARIWIKVFGVPMQPFEFVKISFIFGVSAVLLRAGGVKEFLSATVLSGIHILILVASKDLGAAVIFSVVFLVLFFCVTGQKRWIFGGWMLLGGACVAAYKLFSHVQVRVLAWRDPFSVVEREGYQLAQSLFAMGNGGFFGTGLFRGAPEQIPVVTTDYIFSAVCEELGILFGIGILGIYTNCMILMIRMARRFGEDYYRLVFTGFFALFTTQVVLNVGGVTRMIPSTGVPLPFVSAGGSSAAGMILMFMLMQGMQERSADTEQKTEYKDGFVPRRLSEKSGTAIRTCSVGFLAVMGVLTGYVMIFSFTQARTVIFHSYNRRQEKLEAQNTRGTIFDTHGNPIAVTVLSSEGEVRKYPYGNLYSHVVGQVQNGSSGLEAVKEIDLLSSSAKEFTKLVYRVRAAQIPGNNLFTTLDTDIQTVVYEAMKGKKGAVCVLDLKDGGLSASVSLPDFHPETVTEYKEAEEGPLFNRGFYGEYPVGAEGGLLYRIMKCYEKKGIPTPYGEYFHTKRQAVTPFGLALFAEAAAREGMYIKPYVAKSLTDAWGKTVYRTEKKEERLLEKEELRSLKGVFTQRKTKEGISYAGTVIKAESGILGQYHFMVMALVPFDKPEKAIGAVLEYCEEKPGEVLMKQVLEEIVTGCVYPEK